MSWAFAPTRTLFLRELLLDAHLGVWAHEKGRTQKVAVSVTLEVAASDHDDDLNNVVGYHLLADDIRALTAGDHVHLVETLAEHIAGLAMADTRVLAATVRVEKREAITNASGAGVEVRAQRQS
jgi:7,8-dihydroneopterin aldolase/epimerase/oxygenase